MGDSPASTKPVGQGTEPTAPKRRLGHLPPPYPPGRWRLASSDELELTTVWASHILIRHTDAESKQAPLTLMEWSLHRQPSKRPWQQALTLAQDLERRLREKPGDFNEIATHHSEDPATRANGGQLGAMSAVDLSVWPEVLDALAAIEPGEISKVVETESGFHIFRRDPPPESESLAGRHIVLGHDDVPGLRLTHRTDRAPVARSHDEAATLALELVQQLNEDPARFAQLVEAYSDSEDSLRGGDLGVWSNQERTNFRLELLAMAKLDIAQVSSPIETQLGIQILVRDPASERTELGASVLSLPYAASAAASDSPLPSLEQAQKKAEEVRSILLRDPSQLSAFQQAYCCLEAQRWAPGRAPPGALPALQKVAVGQFTPVVRTASALIIARRLDLADVPPRQPTRLTIPTPLGPQLGRLVRSTQPAALARFCREFAPAAQARLDLGSQLAEPFAEVHARLATAFEGVHEPSANEVLMNEAFERLRELLGEARYAQYRRLLDDRIEAKVFGLTAGAIR